MKKETAMTMVLGLGMIVAAAGLASAGTTPGSGIYNTGHDFSKENTRPGMDRYPADPQSRICIFCHTPHNSIKVDAASTDDKFGGAKGVNYLPLWNHVITDNGNTVDYLLYTAGPDTPTKGDHALQAREKGDYNQPKSVSRLCLSCHDGSVAVNAYGNMAGSDTSRGAGNVKIPTDSAYLIGGINKNGRYDLSNHHPVDFNYVKVANNDTEIAKPDVGFFKAKTANLLIADVLNGEIMTCASCHDVHNTNNTGAKFIWQADTRSGFCCVCHLKCEK